VIRRATAEDAETAARLLHDFNLEFDDPTPGPNALAERLRALLGGGDTEILLIGEPPFGLTVTRFRRSLWSEGLECYLAELYVAPPHRRRGEGRRLMEATLELARTRGATYMDLGTAETDIAARALYESLGFDNQEGRPDGPVNFYYEREL
jgi:ribosomal protein S18 acetylase RimI-like enzyme